MMGETIRTNDAWPELDLAKLYDQLGGGLPGVGDTTMRQRKRNNKHYSNYQVPVNVILSICRQIVVDDQRDLLNVDTTSQEIGGDQNTGRAGTELAHDDVTFLLVHVSVLQEIKKHIQTTP